MKEIRRLQDDYDRVEGILLLPEETLHAVVSGVSGWSIARHVCHVFLVSGASVANIRKLLSDKDAGKERSGGRLTILGLLVLTLGWIPRGRGKAPAAVVPPEHLTREELSSRLDAARKDLADIHSKAAQLRAARGRIRHFIFGALRTLQWLRFARIHTRHHLKIIKDIRRQLARSSAPLVR